MNFFVSWYWGDACYPLYDDDCSLLISITSVPLDWTLRELEKLPRRLLIDSGGFRLIVADQVPQPLHTSQTLRTSLAIEAMKLSEHGLSRKIMQLSPKKVLERQLTLLGGEKLSTIISTLDCPIVDPTLSWQEKDQCITQTIAFAYELKHLLEQKSMTDYVTPLAIIQGYDVPSLKYCAYELASIGFPLYGIGSMASLKQHDLIIERVEAVASIVGIEKLHIFGVSLIQTAQVFRAMGVHSIDSARPAKAAAYNEILYSDPYRRFGILDSPLKNEPLKGSIPRTRRLSYPLPCDCPICNADSRQIMGIGRRANIRDRGVHNYFHLKRLCCGFS
jgi:7-cyano-7-deazaguanine tRNA-ribosyltransferase